MCEKPLPTVTINPVDKRRMCPHCRAFITTDDKICPYCNTQVAKRAVDARAPADALGGLIPQARFTTIVILLINTGLYVATVLYTQRTGGQGGFDPNSNALIAFGGRDARSIVLDGQWWRLITAGFLHGGILHILMNSWVLFDLGAQTEEAFGTARFLVIYLISTATGYIASLFAFLYGWPASASLSIGASAGIFGLIGAMIAFGVREGTSQGAAMRSFYVRWAVYGLIMGFILSFVDNWAHLGGLAGGFAIGYIAAGPRRVTVVERMWQLAAGFTLVITGVAFLNMVMGLLRLQ
jgi:rhomboid protease GluP